MVLEIVGYATRTPSSSGTSFTLTVPAGVQDGDMVHLFVMQPGGSSTSSLSGGTGYDTSNPKLTVSGYSSYYWYKKNASAAESGTVLTVTTSSAFRVSAVLVVTRGQTTTVTPQITKTTPAAGSASSAGSPTSAAKIGYLAFLGTTGDLSTVTNSSATPAMTKVAEALDKTASGASGSVVRVVNGPVASGAGYGGQSLSTTPTGAGRTSGVWLVGLELVAEVISDTIGPNSTVSTTGWNPVGGATIHAVLADADDATYAETGDNPAGSTFTVAFPTLDAGDITVRTKNVATAATPVITRLIELLQTATVIASRTITLPTTAATHSFTLSPSELATVTNRAALRLRITDTAA